MGSPFCVKYKKNFAFVRLSDEVHEEHHDGTSILSGASDITSGSALSSHSSNEEKDFTDILSTNKEGFWNHTDVVFFSSKKKGYQNFCFILFAEEAWIISIEG